MTHDTIAVIKEIIENRKLEHLIGLKEELCFDAKTKDAYGLETPDSDMQKEIEVDTDDLLHSPPHVAYRLIEKVFLWFNNEVNKIPYIAQDTDGNRYIDVEQIKKIR